MIEIIRQLPAHRLANPQFPILSWEEFLFVKPRVHAVLGQAGVESAHGVTVRVGVAEEDFEGAFGFWHSDSVLEFQCTKLT